MSKVMLSESYLDDIADAIRAKKGTQDTYTPAEMADAIESISGGGITPTGTISITENGTVDVTQYASADVNVPSVTPTGTINITQNGTTDVTQYATANVNVPNPSTGTKQISITQNGTTTEDVTNYANAEISVSVPVGETVYYNKNGTAYVKNIVSPCTETNEGYEYMDELETIYAPYATGVLQYSGGRDCPKLKSVHFPRVTSITQAYFIREQDQGGYLESIEIGSVGYAVTSLAATSNRWFYGKQAQNCTITIYVNASTLAEVPSNVSNYVNGTSHQSGTTRTIVYKNSTTGEVITA